MQKKSCFLRRSVAIAASALCLSMSPAWADISLSGQNWVGPTFLPIGPGNTTLPATAVWVGGAAQGSLLMDNGSFLQLARLSFGTGGTGNGTGLITGSGTRLELVGDGASNSQVQRLNVGDWGVGQLTISGGAVVDTSTAQASCLLAFHYCDSFVATAAGDTAVLNVQGAGSQLKGGQNLFIGAVGLGVQHLDGYTFGVPGGTARGTVNITDGGLVSTHRLQVGTDHWSTNNTGSERNIGELKVSGPGSRMVVTGGARVDHATGNVLQEGGSVTTANHRNATAIIDITNGGTMELQGTPGRPSFMNLTGGGGRTEMLISGTGSSLAFTGDGGTLQVGRRVGTARLEVLAGGSITGLQYLSLGRDGAFADMVIDGPGSLVSVNALQGATATTPVFFPSVDIGRNGTGVLTVRNGARLEISSTADALSSAGLSLGRDAASSGTLNIDGPNSVVRLSSASVVAGGGATEAFNPFVRIGRDGSGLLNITNGGKLLLEGNAISTPEASRSTAIYVGGTASNVPGGRGIANIDGAGSEIRLTGPDAFFAVGRGPQSFGQLTLSDRAQVSSLTLSVGDAGGTGVLKMDNASMFLTGQQTGDVLAGPSLLVGRGGGVGVATITNGSLVHIGNMGSAGAGMSLGGSGTQPNGDGSLTLSGGSRIEIVTAPGLSTLNIGRSGSGLMRVRGASSVDVGSGDVYIGRLKGSDGTLLMSENSSLKAGWVGIGRHRTATGSEDGGTGTMVLVNSTLTADTIVIGSNGFLGGTGTITGNVQNFGIFAPGNSPGTLEIQGSFVAEAGSRMILEVESDGKGGFLTDLVIFNGSELLDLSQLNAEFRFLGNTDPNAFAKSKLFALDTFFQQRDAAGGLNDLSLAQFATASFTAQAEAYQITSFAFNTASGGFSVAAAVPEPETWAMLLAGLTMLAAVARRRRTRAGDRA